MMAFVYAEILLLAIAFPKSRKVSFLTLAFMLVMYCFVFYKGDIETYKWIYDDYGVGLSETSFEPGFTFLIILCKKMGLPFVGFRVVLGLIFVFLLNRGIGQLTEYRALALALSAIFPFFVFTSVLRSGIACVIILNGYRFLIDPAYGKRGIVKYSMLVFFAMLFHYSSVLMIAFIFARKHMNSAKVMRYLIIVVLLTVFLNQTDVIFKVISRFTTREKILQWFVRGEGTSNLKGTIAILLVLAMNALLAKRGRLQLARIEGATDFTERESLFVFNSSLLFFLFFPLMVFASPFMRIPFMMMPLIIANGVNASFAACSKKRNTAPLDREISLQLVFLTVSLFIWKLYYDLPYLKAGSFPFQELFRTQFWLG